MKKIMFLKKLKEKILNLLLLIYNAKNIPSHIMDAAIDLERFLPRNIENRKNSPIDIHEIMANCKIMNAYGDMLNPFDLKKEDFRPELFATSLSREMRFWNQTKYSVAEHCLNMVGVVEKIFPGDKNLAQWAMMHELFEAYTGDLATPFKRCLPEYEIAEKKALATYATILNIPTVMPKQIHFIDKRIMIDEAIKYMPNNSFWTKLGKQIGLEEFGVELEPFPKNILTLRDTPLTPDEAEIRYAKKWIELGMPKSKQLEEIANRKIQNHVFLEEKDTQEKAESKAEVKIKFA